MQIELDLLDNSYDYLNETLRYYKELGYNETHDPDRDDMEKKKQWKTTFVLLVQAVELLLKEKLFRINAVLIFEDIDSKINNHSKTIGYSKSIDRLFNLNSKLLKDDEIQFLKSCGNLRNQFIHYKVELNSMDIKIKYCKLFEMYVKLHYSCLRKKYINEKYKYQIINILDNAKDLQFYRGNEFTSKQLKDFKKETADGQLFKYGIANNVAYERVKYGHTSILWEGIKEHTLFNEKEYRYCGDCLAILNEFHQVGCDCELCPKCGNQLITCGCFDEFYGEEYIIEKGINKIIKSNN